MDTNSNRIKENHTIAADILDDLASRFIINIPDKERSDFIRMCFQIELAHWFYLDFYCTGEDTKVLVPCGIKQFASHIFNHIPFLSAHVKKLDVILQEWKQYKMSVPTYGAILMTSDLRHVLLVQSYWAKSSWGFPKGKVNENEDPLRCAIREVYEETGYDITNLADSDAFIEGVLNYQYTRLYLIRNVPIETVFVPRTRKEIKCCEWFSIEHLPTHKTDPVSKNHLNINANSFFMIMPFVKRLKKWINEQNGPVPVKALLMSNGGQLTKKSKGDSGNASKNGATQPQQQQPAGPHASNNNNNNTNNTNNVNVNTTNQCHTNSPRVVFFKNNAVPRRQRHKSMGDLDAANVVTRESSSTETNQTPTAASVQTPNAHGKQQHVQNSGKRTGDGASQSSDGNGKTVGGKRKLFSGTAPDQVIVKRTSSPLIQLQPNSKNSNKTNANQLNGNAKPNSSTTGSAGKPENIKKKRNGKQWPSTDPNARAENIVTKLTFDQLMATATVSSGTDYQSENEGRQASGAKALSWQNIFNPPPLTQLLRNEPSINIWRNVRLNKDVIMNESMKNLL